MKHIKRSRNQIFRELVCGLSIEETAQLCFKSEKTVRKGDKGKVIPKACKLLMRNNSRLELSYDQEWQGFRMNNQRLELPTGKRVTPQEILNGIGLLEIGGETESKNSRKILRCARAIARLLKNK